MEDQELQMEFVRQFCRRRIQYLRNKRQELLQAREEMDNCQGGAPREEYAQNLRELQAAEREQLVLMTDFDRVVDMTLETYQRDPCTFALAQSGLPSMSMQSVANITPARAHNDKRANPHEDHAEERAMLRLVTSLKPPAGAGIANVQDNDSESLPEDAGGPLGRRSTVIHLTGELKAAQVENTAKRARRWRYQRTQSEHGDREQDASDGDEKLEKAA